MTATPALSTYLARGNFILIIHAVIMAVVPDLEPSEPRTPGLARPTHDIPSEPISSEIQPHKWDDPPKWILLLRVVLDRTLKIGTQAAIIIATTPIPAMGGLKTTVTGGIKTLIMALTLILTGAGIDVSGASGVLSLPPGSGWTLMVGAVLYLILTALQGIFSEDRPDMHWRTTLIAISKALMGGIGTVLLTRGIDVTTGQILLSPTAEGWIIASVCGYFILSAVQAFATVDWDGDWGVAALVGGFKAALGVVATLLVSAGVEVTAAGPVVTGGEGIWAMILYGLYTILSFVQAWATKDKEPTTPVSPAL